MTGEETGEPTGGPSGGATESASGEPTDEQPGGPSGGATKGSSGEPTEGRSGPRARTGRRPGQADTQARILAAAREIFAEAGFDGTTIRGVAARAGVDPALVHHYFGTKQRLFVAAMELPPDILAVIPQLATMAPGEMGSRIAHTVLGLWDRPDILTVFLGLIRSATTDPVAAEMFRKVLVEGPLLALARAAARPDADMRALLVGTQLVGLAMARYIIKAEPVASMSTEVLADAIAPTIQRYLKGDIGQ